MNLLLDSNALVWLNDANKVKSLGKNTRRLIETSSITYFSSVSIAELTIKSILGKGKKLSTDQVTAVGLIELEFKGMHADAIPNFQSLARPDPFDHMLLAQAYTENLTFLTSDEALLDLGLPYVVDARE